MLWDHIVHRNRGSFTTASINLNTRNVLAICNVTLVQLVRIDVYRIGIGFPWPPPIRVNVFRNPYTIGINLINYPLDFLSTPSTPPDWLHPRFNLPRSPCASSSPGPPIDRNLRPRPPPTSLRSKVYPNRVVDASAEPRPPQLSANGSTQFASFDDLPASGGCLHDSKARMQPC